MLGSLRNRDRPQTLIDRITSCLLSMATVLAPLPAMSAELGPLASGGAAGVRQAQAENNPPVLWLLGAGAVAALGTMLIMNNNGGAIASGTLAAGGNAGTPGQGSNGPGAMSGGSGGGSGNGAFDAVAIINSGGSPAIVVVTTTTTTTGTH